MTRRTLRTIAHSLMVHARISEAYIHFVLMYTADHIFPVLPIKDLINEDGEPTTTFKISTGTKPSVSYLRVLFCPCAIRKATANVGTKAINTLHLSQEVFCGVFVGIPQHQKGYLVYVTHIRKIISSYNVVFDESFYIALAYTSQPYEEEMSMQMAVSYISYDISSKEKTGNIIKFTHFEEGGLLSQSWNLLSKTCDDIESGNDSDDDSTLPPLISE